MQDHRFRGMVKALNVQEWDVVLNERRACDRESGAEADAEKHCRRGDRDSCDSSATEATNPECINELICGLQYVRECNWHCEREERFEDRSFEELTGVGHLF